MDTNTLYIRVVTQSPTPRCFMRTVSCLTFSCTLLLVLANSDRAIAQYGDTPQSRMRPIGSLPNANQAARAPAFQQRSRQVQQANFQSPGQRQAVRQTMWMQNPGAGIALPPNPTTLPNSGPPVPVTAPPNAGGIATPPSFQPGVNAAPILPSSPNLPVNPQADVAPVPQPQLNGSYATVNNCNLVTPASGYSAAFGNAACGNVVPQNYVAPVSNGAAPTTFAAPPAQIAAPAILPSNRQSSAPLRSIFSFGQESNTVQVGQGLWGQPKAYVTSQPVRNWIRYFFP